jgi:hypothetical protein
MINLREQQTESVVRPLDSISDGGLNSPAKQILYSMIVHLPDHFPEGTEFYDVGNCPVTLIPGDLPVSFGVSPPKATLGLFSLILSEGMEISESEFRDLVARVHSNTKA